MSIDLFYSQLKTAHNHVNHAIDHLNDALATSEARLLEPKYRRLLQTTRNNLRRHRRVLLDLVSKAMNIAYPTNPFPLFEIDSPSKQQRCGKSQSPHNGQ